MARSTEPQNITKRDWYYEEKTGLLLVHQVYADGTYLCTDQIKIPWRKIEASLKRVKARKRRAAAQ